MRLETRLSGGLAATARAAELAGARGASTPALERILNLLPLTDREREIAVMVAAGLSNKSIADRLCVSVRTVEGHIYKACTKLDVANRATLARSVAARDRAVLATTQRVNPLSRRLP
jgi:DNA-binding NarL/FixJ family response regulator